MTSTNTTDGVIVDGSEGTVGTLCDALAAALDGGRTVLPYTRDLPDLPAAPGAAVIISTSGSTGSPKRVALSAAALRASAAATAARLGGPARWLLALPAEHIAGVQVIVRALLAGSRPEIQDLRAGFRADDFAAATARLDRQSPGARRYTSLVPTQLARLLDDGGAGLDAARSFAAVLVGGAALPAALHERALAAGIRVVTTYGMSETAGGCVYDGVPLDGVTVELGDDGRIQLGGPTLADGYVNAPAETAAAFVDGRFRTGDLGTWRDGRLVVLGRADDVIVTGGEKVAPAAVERVLTAQPGVTAACVVGVPDAEWGEVVAAAIVLGPNSADARDPDGAAAAVRAELGRHAVPRRMLVVESIPLRGVGKPDRDAVAALFHPPG